MSPKRSASQQVAFRLEPELANMWADFIRDTLIPAKAHLACAMLMYMTATPAQRAVTQKMYARFQRTGSLDQAQLRCDLPVDAIAAEERKLLEAYRGADVRARAEALANLLDRPAGSNAHSADIA